MNWIFLSFFTLGFLTSCIQPQQEYSANSVLACNNNDEAKPSPAFLYTCNGQNSSCRAFLIFKSQPPYNSVSAISALISSNPSELARINNITRFTVFPSGKEVIVPVNCSCSGQYYQANTTFYIPTNHETYFMIANNTFQGLSTCDTLKRINPYGEFRLQRDLPLQVPLRCACPTKNQIAKSTKYLLTYPVSWKDNVSYLGERFNVSAKRILDANGFSEENPTLFPFTTILIPLPTEPLNSQTVIHNDNHKLEVSPPPISKTRKNKSKGKLYVCVGIAVGCSLLVFSIIILTVFLFYKKRTEGVLQSNGRKTKSFSPKDLLAEIARFDQVLKEFKFEELKKATENFSYKSRIKGSVYRGVFSREVLAIKRMSLDVSQQVKMLSKINHFNLIKLRGVCEHHGSFYLVFDYMKNGSLRDWLRSSHEAQSWTQRIQIALDIANGLHYLHSFTKPAYVHKDIRSSNVLLDGNLRAKIANFSLARTAAKETNNHALTTRVVGTRGYMAPEYTESGWVNPKIDVYAFGVVMLELITGKYAVLLRDGQEVLLSAAVASIMEGEDAETKLGCLVDPGLGENGGMKYALQVANLSLTCLKRDPASRPSMGEVASILLKIQVHTQKSESCSVEFASEKN